MPPEDCAPSRLATVELSCDLIDTILTRDGATVSELTDALNASDAAVHDVLSGLRSRGLVERDTEAETYILSRQFITLGEHVRNDSPLFVYGREEADRLAATTDEVVHLITDNLGVEVGLYESFGDRAVATEFYVRNRKDPNRHLHSSAAGKAILAHQPDEAVERALNRHGLPAATEHTITDRDVLFEELARTRERGYAINDEEVIERIRAVAAPILGPEDTVLGSVSLSAPITRLKGERFESTVPKHVIDTSNEIERNLAYHTE